MRQGDAESEAGTRGIGLVGVLTGILGGPIAWSLHLAVSYFIVALACTTGWRGAGVGIALGLTTVVFLALSAAAGAYAWHRWRALGGGGQSWESALGEPQGKAGMLWLIGVALAVLFGVIILFAGLPPLFVQTCTEV